jgi:hypothetical protein
VPAREFGRIRAIEVNEVPSCGSKDAVLRAHGLDRTGIANQVLTLVSNAAAN